MDSKGIDATNEQLLDSLNLLENGPRLIVYSGIGFPASLQLSLIFSIPRPHASIKPALKNVLAIKGVDRSITMFHTIQQ